MDFKDCPDSVVYKFWYASARRGQTLRVGVARPSPGPPRRNPDLFQPHFVSDPAPTGWVLRRQGCSLPCSSGWGASRARSHVPLSRSSPTDLPTQSTPVLGRWLVHAASWATISTTSQHLDGIAFGNALSYSDGPIGHSTGRLLFYLTLMDATATDAAAHPNATLTLCEAQLPGGCEGVDPEDPTCAKLSITGELAPVRGGADAEAEARALLFSRHPQMADWPSGHKFRVYELTPATLRLLDFYGGPHDISPAEYFAAAVGVESIAVESL